MCFQSGNLLMEVENKCPHSNNRFIEEMQEAQASSSPIPAERDLSLWAPILLCVLRDGLGRSRRSNSMSLDDTGDSFAWIQTEVSGWDGE